MPVGISPGYHHLLDVDGVLGHESMAKIIKCMPKLARSGFQLILFGIEAKSKVSTSYRQGFRIGFTGKLNLTCLSMVGGINPIVYIEPQVGDLSFLVVFKKPGKQNLLFVGLPVSIGISHIPNIRGCGNQQPILPG